MKLVLRVPGPQRSLGRRWPLITRVTRLPHPGLTVSYDESRRFYRRTGRIAVCVEATPWRVVYWTPTLRPSAPNVSGDWRADGGRLRLVGMVVVPGQAAR